MPPKKQYGLIKRNKKPETKLVASKLSFFDDGDSVWGFKKCFDKIIKIKNWAVTNPSKKEEEKPLDKHAEKKRIEAELQKVSAKKKMNKQTQVKWLVGCLIPMI